MARRSVGTTVCRNSKRSKLTEFRWQSSGSPRGTHRHPFLYEHLREGLQGMFKGYRIRRIQSPCFEGGRLYRACEAALREVSKRMGILPFRCPGAAYGETCRTCPIREGAFRPRPTKFGQEKTGGAESEGTTWLFPRFASRREAKKKNDARATGYLTKGLAKCYPGSKAKARSMLNEIQSRWAQDRAGKT